MQLALYHTGCSPYSLWWDRTKRSIFQRRGTQSWQCGGGNLSKWMFAWWISDKWCRRHWRAFCCLNWCQDFSRWQPVATVATFRRFYWHYKGSWSRSVRLGLTAANRKWHNLGDLWLFFTIWSGGGQKCSEKALLRRKKLHVKALWND